MKRVKIYLASAIFLAITLLKLLSPSLAGELRARLLPAVRKDMDYQTVMVDLGRRLSESQIIQAMGRADEASVQAAAQEPYSPVTIGQLRAQTEPTVQPRPEQTQDTDTPPEPEAPQPEPVQPEVSPVPAVVEAFLQSQAAFSDYAVPANVSYEMPALPFACAVPVSGMTSSGFGYRMHPLHNEVRFHYGTDFAAGTGTEILAFADGSVLAAGQSDSYGNYIILDHGNGYQSLYAHCSAVYVSWGEQVSRGSCIGLVGATGQVTGPHLHFELICDNTYLNPEFYLEGT